MGWESKIENLQRHCTSEAAFAVALTHVPKVGDIQNLNGIWSDTYASVSPEDGISVMTSEPNAGFKLSDFVTVPKKGDRFIKAGVTYFVVELEPDGEGMTTLIFEKEK